MRVFIMGSSGAGKTDLAVTLSNKLGLPHLELDSLRHQANWQELPDDQFRREVKAFCAGRNWVVDGNYSVVRSLVVEQATDIVLLDYSKTLVMFRLLIRSMNRVLFRKKLWNGNREKLRYLLSANPEINVVLWSWNNFERRRDEFLQLQNSIENNGLVNTRIYRVTNKKQLRALKDQLSSIATD